MAKAGPVQGCPHCKAGAETFQYLRGKFVFDVDLAREIVGDGRQPVEMEPEDVVHSVDISRIYDEHVAHVNPQYPGIVAHLWFPTEDGEIVQAHVLIDGHHRAARCLKDKRPFLIHLLSEDESRQILIHSPELSQRTPALA